jgi:alpha-beta hydrolase superfamily lysophospholipase
MKHVDGKFEGRGGLGLYYQSWQPDGEAKACVALTHGFGEHSGRYSHVGEKLVAAGYALYAYDLRGHGRSDGARGQIMDWAEFREDTQAFLKFVKSQAAGRPVFLYGHSLGGLVALESALRYQDGLRGVVASAPVLTPPALAPVLFTVSRIMSRVAPKFSLKVGLETASLSRDPAVVRAYETDPLVHGTAAARLGTEMQAAVDWTHAHAGEWKLPLLMIHGQADRLCSIDGTRRFSTKVSANLKTVIEYPGGYHESHNDIHWEQVLGDVTVWLDKQCA